MMVINDGDVGIERKYHLHIRVIMIKKNLFC